MVINWLLLCWESAKYVVYTGNGGGGLGQPAGLPFYLKKLLISSRETTWVHDPCIDHREFTKGNASYFGNVNWLVCHRYTSLRKYTKYLHIDLHSVPLMHQFVDEERIIQLGAEWLCGIVLNSWHKGCEFDPGSRQLLGERISSHSLILAKL